MRKILFTLIMFFSLAGNIQANPESEDKTADEIFCGSGNKIVSKKAHNNSTTYTCSNGKTFEHGWDGLIK